MVIVHDVSIVQSSWRNSVDVVHVLDADPNALNSSWDIGNYQEGLNMEFEDVKVGKMVKVLKDDGCDAVLYADCIGKCYEVGEVGGFGSWDHTIGLKVPGAEGLNGLRWYMPEELEAI